MYAFGLASTIEQDATSRYPDELSGEEQDEQSKPIPHIPLPFKEVMADVLKVKAPKKSHTGKREKSKE